MEGNAVSIHIYSLYSFHAFQQADDFEHPKNLSKTQNALEAD
jgi:hypothetical protein